LTKVLVRPDICCFDGILEAVSSDRVVKLQIMSECDDFKKLETILTKFSPKIGRQKCRQMRSSPSCPIACAPLLSITSLELIDLCDQDTYDCESKTYMREIAKPFISKWLGEEEIGRRDYQ